MSYYAIDNTKALAHHGILGMKWGVRRYQNEDGSLTSAGRIRYYGSSGKARHYKDALKKSSRRLDPRTFKGKYGDKDYRNWVKEDPRNRRFQRVEYEQQRMIKELGGKKAYSDAKYAYDHKKLARYVNRDGSLTGAGKIRYYGAGGDRKGYYNQIGSKKMQRDIERDKNTKTTSQKLGEKMGKKAERGALKYLNNIYNVTPSVAGAAIASRQKDPTKYIRKNTKNIRKTALKLGVNAVTGNVIGGIINGEKLAYYSTVGNAKALRKTANRVAGNVVRGTAGAAVAGNSLASKYAIPSKAGRYIGKQYTTAIKTGNKVRDSGAVATPTYTDYRKKQEQEKLRQYNKVTDTAKNTINKITGKKKKRN